MESTGNSGSSAAAAQSNARRREPPTAAAPPHGPEPVATSPTTTRTRRDRSPRTADDDDLDNDSDQDDPVFDPPLRRVSASAAGAVPRLSHPIDDPPATTTAGGTGTGTAFRDGPVKRKKLGGLVWELENKGAVARDHLALERTFLAWLRTSLALASIGIAVTQLFRLPSGTATVPQTPSSAVVDSSPSPPSSFLINSLATSSYAPVAALAPVFASQQAQLATLVSQNVSQFSYLAKPIGGTFLALALLFLALGTYRFFHVQAAFVSEPSMFPPSQKTYGFSTFCIGALIVATFAAVLATS